MAAMSPPTDPKRSAVALAYKEEDAAPRVVAKGRGLVADAIIARARDILQDSSGVRWLDAELLRWISDGQNEIALYKPEATSVTEDFDTAAQTKQTLPATGLRLLKVVRNRGATSAKADGNAIRVVSSEILDAQNPGWHSAAGVDTVLHYIHDMRDPKVFYLFPKPNSGRSIEICYSKEPTAITSTGNTISLLAIFLGPLLDYVLHRCYLKDSEFAGNAQRAAAHYAVFANAMGIKEAKDIQFGPKSNSELNPNVQTPRAG